jgi:hypothetical protein
MRAASLSWPFIARRAILPRLWRLPTVEQTAFHTSAPSTRAIAAAVQRCTHTKPAFFLVDGLAVKDQKDWPTSAPTVQHATLSARSTRKSRQGVGSPEPAFNAGGRLGARRLN